MEIGQAIAQLRQRNRAVPRPLDLPSDAEVATAERKLGVAFPHDYRRFLLEASDVVVPTMEPCTVTADSGYRDLVTVAHEAWEMGVPHDWLPFCEDNGDYFCLDGNIVRYWSHNGDTDEHWSDLGTWIDQVWIGKK